MDFLKINLKQQDDEKEDGTNKGMLPPLSIRQGRNFDIRLLYK